MAELMTWGGTYLRSTSSGSRWCPLWHPCQGRGVHVHWQGNGQSATHHLGLVSMTRLDFQRAKTTLHPNYSLVHLKCCGSCKFGMQNSAATVFHSVSNHSYMVVFFQLVSIGWFNSSRLNTMPAPCMSPASPPECSRLMLLCRSVETGVYFTK